MYNISLEYIYIFQSTGTLLKLKTFLFVHCNLMVNQCYVLYNVNFGELAWLWSYLKPWFVYVGLSLCSRFHKHIQGGIPNHSQLFVEVVHSVHLQSEQSLFNTAIIIQVPRYTTT